MKIIKIFTEEEYNLIHRPTEMVPRRQHYLSVLARGGLTWGVKETELYPEVSLA